MMWIRHRAATAERDWSDGFQFAHLEIDDRGLHFSFTTDYGKGEREFELTLDKDGFAAIAWAMMECDQDAATAALSAALAEAYPVET